MTNVHELKTIPDDELLRRLSDLLGQSRRVESVLVAHIAEVDARRLYAREAGSMFTYCTEVLHLSEHEAYARIAVARASRRYPILLDMLGDGRLHLSGISKLVPHLTDDNAEGLLVRATHKTKSEIEKLIAEIAPKPDVPTVVRKLPTPAVDNQLGPDRVAIVPDIPALPISPISKSELAARVPCRPAKLTNPVAAVMLPLASARYKVQFTASAELHDKLERLQALTRDDLATVIDVAVTEKLERVESRRFGSTRSPRTSLDQTDTTPSSRYIPAAVRRVVRQRDGNQCTFVGQSGARCTERRNLELHHREPFGRGGAHSPDNVCVMCSEHNAYLAERDYGKERMRQYRRPDRVSNGHVEYMAVFSTGEAGRVSHG